MARLHSNTEGAEEGKFLVLRRDGSIPQWPYFVIGAADPAAPAALRAYAAAGTECGFDPAYLDDLRDLADKFEEWRAANGTGDPDAPPHRQDDPRIIELMRQAKGA
jgi:hypothetical protein